MARRRSGVIVGGFVEHLQLRGKTGSQGEPSANRNHHISEPFNRQQATGTLLTSVSLRCTASLMDDDMTMGDYPSESFATSAG